MDIISTDDVPGSGTSNVNAIAIVELLHDVVDFVVFDDVVVGVEEGADLFEGGFGGGAGFVTSDGADELAGVSFF